MHRVDIQTKKTLMLRILAYAVTIMLSVVTTAVLLLVAMGYRFNTRGSVVQSGLLLVDNKPEAAQIYIDDKQVDSQSPGRFVLPAGQYKLSLGLDGYRGWQKQINMKAEYVEQVQYPLLIPNTLQSTSLIAVAKPRMVSQSNDKKQLLYSVAGESQLHAIELDTKQPAQTTIALSAAFVREAGTVGTIDVIEWSLNNKHVLLLQALPSGKTNIISLNLDRPEEAINITTDFSDVAPTDVHYEGNKTDSVYGLHEQVLRRYDITNTGTSKIMDRVISYQPYGDSVLAFTRLSSDAKKLEAGVTNQRSTAVLETFADPASRPLVAYGEYSGHSYLVVAGNTATQLYRDPLKKPILKKQIPFVTLDAKQASLVKFSPNNGYVFIQSGTSMSTFDFENVRKHRFELTQLRTGSLPTWMNDSHISFEVQNNLHALIEFDGANQADMVTADAGTNLYYAGNQRSVYRLLSVNQKTTLDNISLVAK